MSKDMPLISVVVPVYGTEKYLRKCLDSILNQTYKNIEVIVVNDATKDKSGDIIDEYLEKYDNVKCVKHKKNMGLFQARVSGSEEATGDYIAFIDSDDYISCDYYRVLMKKALENDADMVLADFCLEYESNGMREYYNHDPIRLQDIDYKDDDVLRAYMEQRGLFYSWQVIWNKLISRSLWEKCLSDYQKFSSSYGHLIMTEDIAFSSNLWINAKHVMNVHNVFNFYVQNSNQSIKNDKSYKKYLKNETDVLAVFDFFKEILVKNGKYETFKDDFIEWKRLYGRIYYGIFNDLPDKPDIEKFNYSAFEMTQISWPEYNDNFFYSLKTPLSENFNWYENIKRDICSVDCQIVSFDIFDTLILRKWYNPVDLFTALNKKFTELFSFSSYLKFSDIRVLAERNIRRIKDIDNPQMNEVTIEEIYDYISSKYCFDKNKLHELMKYEAELEIECSSVRKSGRELYDLARFCKKKIIFTSDMYLSEDTVSEMLNKNGYTEGELLVSSKLKVTKATGIVYDYILKKYNVKSNHIVHIGDNWFPDVEKPLSKKMKAHYLPKAKDVFESIINSFYTGNGYKKNFSGYDGSHDLKNSVNSYVALRNVLGQVSNKFFDMPYVSINQNSDYNANPNYIGYYVVGMYAFSIAHWLLKHAKKDGMKKIHFVARDGYLIKRAYDEIAKYDPDAPDSNYLYVSRATTAVLDINRPVELYSLYYKMSAWHATPNKVLALIKDVLLVDKKEILKDIPADVKFNSREEFDKFITYLISEHSDKLDFKSNKEKAKKYFSSIISENEAIFDIGYSGRVELALTKLLGYPLNSYYIHKNSDGVNDKMLQAGFKSVSFYSYKPMITGVIREHIMMMLTGTTLGYDYENGAPIVAADTYDYATKFMTQTVQDNAVKLVEDIMKNFGHDVINWCFEYEDMVVPFENYLHNSSKVDRTIFSTLIFEDDMGEGKKFRAVDFWNNELKKFHNENPSKIASSNIIDDHEIGVNTAPVIKISKLKKNADKKKSNEKKKTAIFLDKIEETDKTETKFEKCAGNTSNLVEWDAIESSLKPKVIKNWFMTNPGGFEDDEFDVFLTTNLIWIEENTDLTYLDNVLKRIGKDKILLPVGIGFTTDTEKKNFALSKESVKVLSSIAERCVSVGVRGEYSCEVLNSFGIKNTRIIGTPSVYAARAGVKKIKALTEKPGNINSSFKPFYGEFTAKEQALLNFFAVNNCSLTDSTKLALSKANITDSKVLNKIKTFENKKNVFFDVDSWKKSFEKTDFAMGMNFNNNVMALASGVPALFVNYESIGRELCKLYKLPNIDISEFDESKSIMGYYKLADYTEFSKAIDARYAEFTDFLKENGLIIRDIENRIIEK